MGVVDDDVRLMVNGTNGAQKKIAEQGRCRSELQVSPETLDGKKLSDAEFSGVRCIDDQPDAYVVDD